MVEKKLFAAALTSCLAVSAFVSDAELVDAKTSFAREALQPFVDRGELPGAVSVFCDGNRQETCCVGFADVNAGRPISLDDPFQQCSQTKGFCGVTVAILVEEGKLNLDDSVAKYLPEFKTLWVKDSVSSNACRLVCARTPLTVRMCLNHTGGFPFELPSYTAMGGWSRRMPLRSVAACAAALPLEFEPGTEARYSNLGIDIAAAVVEAVTGRYWEDFLKERVLEPLEMRQTTFRPTDEQIARRIRIYETKSGRIAVETPFQPSMQLPYADDRVFASAGAGLWTTARDQLKFYRMLMNLGVGDNGTRILGEETVRRLLAVSSRPEGLKKLDWTKDGYSLGLCAPREDGEDKWFGHGGAWRTRCHVNWHRKQLKLLVVQVVGDTPWDGSLSAAADRFFGSPCGEEDDSLSSGRLGEMSSDDASHNKSTEMNAAAYAGETSVTGGVRVVFLGNSITLHGSLPKIGWTNVWGMAASAKEKDYVHLVTRGIEKELGRKADVRVRNLAEFERGFATYDLAKLDDMVAFEPEVLVVALGENVTDLKTEDERTAFRASFKKLLGRFMRPRAKPLTVVRGVFWPNDWKDACMAHAASDYALPFVKADFGNDLRMKAIGLFAHGGVANHPGDAGMAAIAEAILEGLFPKRSGYSARVDGRPVSVRPIRISAVPFNQWAAGYQRPMDQTEVAGLLRFETAGAAEIVVTPERAFTNAVVRPLGRGVKPVIREDAVRFTIPGPGYYVLELDGKNRPLEIFADAVRDFSSERAAATKVFGPGIHLPVTVRPKSGDRIFLDRDAIVYGAFLLDGVTNVTITGYGTICGTLNRRVGNACYREGVDGAVRIIDSKGVTFDGPTVLDSCCWCVCAFNSCDLALRNLKVTGAWRYNTDGIDICNSQRVRVENCYVHSFDDTLVVKGISHDYVRAKKVLSLDFPPEEEVEDIRFSDCVCWCGWGRTLEVGFETWAKRFRGIVFENCDLIHNEGGALSVHLGGPAQIEDVTFRNIRIEYDKYNLAPQIQWGRDARPVGLRHRSGAWLTVTNEKMFAPDSMYSALWDVASEPHGNFKLLTVSDVDIIVDPGAALPSATVKTSAEPFGEIVLENVRLNGRGLARDEVLPRSKAQEK